MNASLAIHVYEDGKSKVLYAGLDADKALTSYKACELPGKTYCWLNRNEDRQKRTIKQEKEKE